MDNENIYGIKYEVDIESLKTGTKEAGKQIKMANAEFNESASKLDNWATSVEGVSAKIKQMNTILEAEKSKLAQSQNEYNKQIDSIRDYAKKIEDLKNQKQQAIEQYGKESNEVKNLSQEIAKLEREQDSNINTADRLKISIMNQQASVNKTEKSLKGYEEQLEEVKIAQANAEKTGNSLEDELKDMKKASDDTTESITKMEGGFTVVKGAIAGFIANGISNFISGVKSAVEETKEFRKIMGSLEVSSKQAGYTAKETAQEYKKLYGVLGDDQTSATTTANLQALKLEQKDLIKVTDGVIGAWARYGDSIPIDGLAESVNETIKVGKVTGTFADVLNWAGESEDGFNEKLAKCRTETQKANLVMQMFEKQGLTKAGKQWQENNKTLVDANKLQADYTEKIAKLSEKVEPVITSVKRGFLDLFSSIFEGADSIDTDKIASGISSGFQWFIKNIVPPVRDFFGFIASNGDKIVSIIAGIGAGFIAFKIGGLITSLIGAFQIFFTTLATGDGIMKALNVTMNANPFVLIASLIAGLVVAFITLWNTSEEFWIEMWNNISKTFMSVWNAIVSFFTVTIPKTLDNVSSWFQTTCSNIAKFFENAWISIVSFFTQTIPAWIDSVIQWFNMIPYNLGYLLGQAIGHVLQFGIDIWNFATKDIPQFVNNVIEWFKKLPVRIWEQLVIAWNRVNKWGSDTYNTAKEWVSKTIDNIISFFKSLPGKVWTWLSNTASKVLSWGSDLVKNGKKSAQKLVDSVINGIKGLPDKVKDIGVNLVKGLWNGISDMVGWIGNKIKGFGNGVLDGLKNFFGIHSPSTKTEWQGNMLVEGYGNALEKGIRTLKQKSKKLSQGVLNSMQSGLGKGINLETGIISQAKSQLSTALGTMKKDIQLVINADKPTGGTVQNVTFNQTIQSPKALSRLEVYRNTNSLLFSAKAGLKNV